MKHIDSGQGWHVELYQLGRPKSLQTICYVQGHFIGLYSLSLPWYFFPSLFLLLSIFVLHISTSFQKWGVYFSCLFAFVLGIVICFGLWSMRRGKRVQFLSLDLKRPGVFPFTLFYSCHSLENSFPWVSLTPSVWAQNELMWIRTASSDYSPKVAAQCRVAATQNT